MARLASDTKMGFYPTSVETIQKVINKTLSFPEEKIVYALDCCAGEGEAIESIGQKYGCKTYANELDESRAKTASARDINIVLNEDAINGVRKSNHWVGLNFLNPPYGTNALNKRIEIDFIERWGLTTAIGGVLILVINPSSADSEMAKKLQLQGYKPVISFYDPNNEDYKRYGQFFCIFLQQLSNFRASIDKFQSLFEQPLNIDDDIDFEKINIKTGTEPAMFKEIDTPRWKIEKKLEKSNLRKIFFDEMKTASMLNSSIEHPNEGQAAILIASGALNKQLTLSDGNEVILKGTSSKFRKEAPQIGDSGNVETVKLVDSYKTVVYGLNLTCGQFVKYE